MAQADFSFRKIPLTARQENQTEEFQIRIRKPVKTILQCSGKVVTVIAANIYGACLSVLTSVPQRSFTFVHSVPFISHHKACTVLIFISKIKKIYI